jgi:uncharacterized membrane protein
MKAFSLRHLLTGAFLAMLASLIAVYWLPAAFLTPLVLPLVVLVPGFLAYFCITKNFDIGIKGFLYSLGLGLLFITLEGLLLNLVLPLFLRHSAPLTTGNILAVHSIVTGVLFVFCQLYFKTVLKDKILTLPSFRRLGPNLLLCLLPLMAAAGAVELNNGGSNLIALATTCLVLISVIAQLALKKLFSWDWLLFIIASSMLLSTSLRSTYIAGFDISQEFQVFQRTLLHRQWFSSHGDPYNSCLSLTILPTMLHALLNISPAFIFKFVYQMLYAVVPVAIYQTFKVYAKPSWAFLAGLFYVAQTQFITTMPAIVRQEIALVYFSLIILALFSDIKLSYRKTLFMVFSLGLVTAHYSTAYLTILLFILYYLLGKLLPVITRRFSEVSQTNPHPITLNMLVVIILTSLLWYGQVNFSSGNVVTTATTAYRNIGNIFQLDSHSASSQKAFYGHSNVDSQKILQGYLGIGKVQSKSGIAPQGSTVIPERVPILARLVNFLRSVLLIVTKLSLLIGTLYVFFKAIHNDKLKPIAYMGVSSALILLLVGVLPSISLSYNLERLYQQILGLIAFIMVVISFSNLPRLSGSIKYILASAVVILYFALSPGSALVNQLTGGTTPRMNYSNSGDDYQKFYMHSGDILASQWVASDCNTQLLFGDRYSEIKLLASTQLSQKAINQDILNPQLHRCTMLDYTNTHDDIAYGTYQSQEISFNIPANYYVNDYDQVYSNSQDNIYIRAR